jgi:RNA recognition motif-containing protein
VGVKLYVGNLGPNATADDLRILFAQAGTVSSVDVILDRDTGRPKGFAFVTLGTQEEAEHAIQMFKDFNLRDRKLEVSVAKPREERTGPPSHGGAFGRGFAGGQRGGHKRRGGNRRY